MRILFSVPIGTSKPIFPATVTVPANLHVAPHVAAGRVIFQPRYPADSSNYFLAIFQVPVAAAGFAGRFFAPNDQSPSAPFGENVPCKLISDWPSGGS